jgi:HNH endonuclease/AP2 domain
MIKITPLPARDLLLSLFEYQPDTGLLIRKTRPREMFDNDFDCRMWNGNWAGKIAGCLKPGEVTVNFDYVEYRAHRLIWKMVHGDPVPDVIDHIDNDPHNNRIGNLREADHSQNHANAGLRDDSGSGAKGVSWNRAQKKYVAYICFRKKQIHIGTFDTIEEAVAARRAAAEEIHGEFARHE